MKKRINPSIKAQILRSAFILLSLVAVSAIPFALAQSRSRGTTKPSVAASTSQLATISNVPDPPVTATATATATPTPTCAQTMYGGNGNGALNRGALITINQINGSGTVVGTPVSGVGLSGIAFHPDGRLFASTVTPGNPSTLIQVNPDTGGLIATIGTITDEGTPISIGDLIFQPGTGVLYGIGSNPFSSGRFLYTINISTAAATLIRDSRAGTGGAL